MKNQYFKQNIKFNDNGNTKNVISVRDGVQEYLGLELGLEPQDKVFKIYRSPETITSLNELLKDIPITDEHIELKDDIPKNKLMGKIKDSIVVENKDSSLDSTIALQNAILVDKNKLELNKSNELSLGYFADTTKSDKYDFEQTNIRPHHLAIVKSGRCGEVCKFLDQKGDNVMTFDEISKLVGGLSKDEKAKLYKNLGGTFSNNDSNSTKDEDLSKKLQELKEKHTKEIESLKDETVKNYKDSCECKKEMLDYANTRVSVISKAKNYLDDNYDFLEKTNHQIMKDSVSAELPKEKFADNEIGVAFKMLREKQAFQEIPNNFTDSNSKWNQAYDMEIK